MILEVTAGVVGTLIYQRFAKSIKVWMEKKEKQIKENLEK